MQELEFRFTKTNHGYIVSGKKMPCSSITKMFYYIQREMSKHLKSIDKGSIIIREDKDD